MTEILNKISNNPLTLIISLMGIISYMIFLHKIVKKHIINFIISNLNCNLIVSCSDGNKYFVKVFKYEDNVYLRPFGVGPNSDSGFDQIIQMKPIPLSEMVYINPNGGKIKNLGILYTLKLFLLSKFKYNSIISVNGTLEGNPYGIGKITSNYLLAIIDNKGILKIIKSDLRFNKYDSK